MLSIIIERCWFFLRLRGCSKFQQQTFLALIKTKQWSALQMELESSPSLVAIGTQKMLDCRYLPINIIEDIISLWLLEQKTLLHSNIAWLTLFSVVSPLLGLLGTVLGIIDAFQAMSNHLGSISPALLADGLQQAMLTTALGLCIAIPSLVTGHIFRIWANAQLLTLENSLNHMFLSLQDINISDNKSIPLFGETAFLFKVQQI